MQRAPWHVYFIDIAKVVSSRATCDRAHVGAVFVKAKNILATGYNGSVRGQPHCDEAGHDMVEGHCVRTVHAEANAIAQAAKNGVSLINATLYVTHYPCWPCAKLVLNAGVECIVYAASYRKDPRVEEACKALGVQLLEAT